jgi:hypothetical protein
MALAACRKSIAADPKRSDSWFIIASILIAYATADPNGKLQISDETRKSLQQYLTLAPTGPHAADVHQMLSAAN